MVSLDNVVFVARTQDKPFAEFALRVDVTSFGLRLQQFQVRVGMHQMC